jgi:hypothetical protein
MLRAIGGLGNARLCTFPGIQICRAAMPDIAHVARHQTEIMLDGSGGEWGVDDWRVCPVWRLTRPLIVPQRRGEPRILSGNRASSAAIGQFGAHAGWPVLCGISWLDGFRSPPLVASREGTRWLNVLKTLVSYRQIDPGSEWRLHRQWYEQNAMDDLLGEDFSLANKNTLYGCPDKLLAHKTDLFSFLRQRWKALFQAEFDVLLYDPTSTYFECDAPEASKRRLGYSRTSMCRAQTLTERCGARNRTCRSPASGSRTRPHAFTHDTSCPSRLRRTSPKCP